MTKLGFLVWASGEQTLMFCFNTYVFVGLSGPDMTHACLCTPSENEICLYFTCM